MIRFTRDNGPAADCCFTPVLNIKETTPAPSIAGGGRRYCIAMMLDDGTLVRDTVSPTLKERVLSLLQEKREMTRNQIHAAFHSAVPARVLHFALSELEREGLVRQAMRRNGKPGHPPLVWTVV